VSDLIGHVETAQADWAAAHAFAEAETMQTGE
jgi:hypothetical protein